MDKHTITLNEEKIRSRYFIIATGSSANIPSIKGLNEVPYVTNKGIFSLDKLPESLMIVGGGPIGLEIAQAFCSFRIKGHCPSIRRAIAIE